MPCTVNLYMLVGSDYVMGKYQEQPNQNRTVCSTLTTAVSRKLIQFNSDDRQLMVWDPESENCLLSLRTCLPELTDYHYFYPLVT